MEKRKGIVLDENFRIEPDALNFTLIREEEGEINPKTGKPTISKGQWYCPTLQSALRAYLRESSRDLTMEGDNDLKDVLNKLKQIEDAINKIN